MSDHDKARQDITEWSNFNWVKAYQYKVGLVYIAMTRSGREKDRSLTPFPGVPIAEFQSFNEEIKRWQIHDKLGRYIDTNENGLQYPSEIPIK